MVKKEILNNYRDAKLGLIGDLQTKPHCHNCFYNYMCNECILDEDFHPEGQLGCIITRKHVNCGFICDKHSDFNPPTPEFLKTGRYTEINPCYKCDNPLPKRFNYLTVTIIAKNEDDRYNIATICSDLCNNCMKKLQEWLKSDGNKGYRV